MSNDITRLPKWAQAHIAELERQRDEARALLPRREAVPERMGLPTYPEIVFGWDFIASTCRVVPCWTGSNTHWFDQLKAPGMTRHSSGSRDGRRLFATRRAALVALRAAKVEEFGKQLAEIDRQIAKEEVTP